MVVFLTLVLGVALVGNANAQAVKKAQTVSDAGNH